MLAFTIVDVHTAVRITNIYDNTKTSPTNDALSYLVGKVLPVNLYEILMGYDETTNSIKPLVLISPADMIANTFRTITGAVPLVDAIANKDFKGARVYGEAFPNQKKARTDLGNHNVHPAFQAFTDWLFDVSGGKKDKKGELIKTPELNINPSILEHLVGGYFAGVPVVAKDLWQNAAQKISGDKWDFSKTPLINRSTKNMTSNGIL